MKKSALFAGLLAIATLSLTACGNSKDFNMSFDEALEIASHSPIQDIIANSDYFQQSFDVTADINTEGTNMIANLQSESKQNIDNNKSESTTKFDLKVKESDVDVSITGALALKLVDDSIYLNLESLGVSGSDDMSLLAAMFAGFIDQRYYIPMTGLSDVPSSLSYVKDAKDLNAKAKEMFINEGSVVYNGMFDEFKGYNARKFSLDNEKLQELLNEYLRASVSEDLPDEAELPEINIQNFEGYLVLVGKDKVATVIDNMDMIQDDIDIKANGFSSDNHTLNLSANGENVITFSATKKRTSYDVSLLFSSLASIEGTITPSISKSQLQVKFDAVLRVNDENNITTIPLKGNRTYKAIDDFSVSKPENATDLSETIASYLGAMMGTGEYDFEELDAEGLDYEEVDNPEITENAEQALEEIVKEVASDAK